jgi:hypothetical protein
MKDDISKEIMERVLELVDKGEEHQVDFYDRIWNREGNIVTTKIKPEFEFLFLQIAKLEQRINFLEEEKEKMGNEICNIWCDLDE